MILKLNFINCKDVRFCNISVIKEYEPEYNGYEPVVWQDFRILKSAFSKYLKKLFAIQHNLHKTHLIKNKAHQFLLSQRKEHGYSCLVINCSQLNDIFMRASLKLLVVVAFTTVANVALAHVDKAEKEKSAEISAQIFSPKNDMIYVQLEKAGKGKVSIQISDIKGNIIHFESLEDQTKILKRFDISKLPSGVYFYEVSSEYYILKKKIAKE